MIVIIDYGLGNLGSVSNMLRKIGVESIVSSNKTDIESADKLILPGVVAFDQGMTNLKNYNLIETLNRRVLNDKVPILGICLGLQIMTQGSEEGVLDGLGWFDAKTIKFDKSKFPENLKIPHMGWNDVTIAKDNKLFTYDSESRYYFVHSYHVTSFAKEDILTQTDYGYNFVSSLSKDNMVAVQFHPEKSHKFGMKLISNFIQNY